MPTRIMCAALLVFLASTAGAETALIAVATNFVPVAEALAPGFAAATGHQITITGGSTGKLYAQIAEAAPFEVFLSADQATPARLIAEGLAVSESRFTYATGALALWSADADRIGPDGATALADAGLRFVAIANPDLAPYGQAAKETLQALDLWDRLQPKIVMGQNVGAAFALTSSGAAELGFVALSAVIDPGLGGSTWIVPPNLYAPLHQDAVLLTAGSANPAAVAFLDYLTSPEAVALITNSGYTVGP
jgi:molybdate transport system substrate-binding protein